MKLFILLFLGAFALFPLVRCIVFNLHYVGFYTVYDIIDYFKNQKWKVFNCYGIDMFVGMFGHGKTLSMTHKARQLYAKYGDSIQFISNYHLRGIPYTPLVNFNQLVGLGEDEEVEEVAPELEVPFFDDAFDDDNKRLMYELDELYDYDDDIDDLDEEVLEREVEEVKPHCQGTVVCIDEIQTLLNHRNFSNFPLSLLYMLCQQRKRKIYIMCTAQRFAHVDKLFRDITTHVIDCNKTWRFQNMKYYDAFDVENAVNTRLVKPLINRWWFVRNIDFDSYDTEQMISRQSAADFISNEESIVKKGESAQVNELAIKRKNKRVFKRKK